MHAGYRGSSPQPFSSWQALDVLDTPDVTLVASVPVIERIERIERTGDSQTDVVVTVAGGVIVAVGGTQILRVIVPRAAAHHALA